MERAFGLDRSRIYAYYIDDFSTPDSWKVGFEIVYRFIFHIEDKEASSDKAECMRKFKNVFREVFGLPEYHYELQSGEREDSVFWRVYWDAGPLDMRLLTRCEAELHCVAVLNQVNVELVELTIIPRSLSTISEKAGNK